MPTDSPLDLAFAACEGRIGQVAYNAAKGATVGMTPIMVRDLGTLGIQV